VTSCACGATTDGEPWHEGWGRWVTEVRGRNPAVPVTYDNRPQCPACFAARQRRESFALAVEHEESLP